MTGEFIRTLVAPTAVVLTPGVAPVGVEVRVFNLSTIVDTFIVEAPNAPQWMRVPLAQLPLLPNTDDTVRLELSIPEGSFVPAVQSSLEIRVRSVSDPLVTRREYVQVTVPPNEADVELRLEPSILRLHDRSDGALYAHADNQHGNRPLLLSLSGTDAEGIVRFSFHPPALHIPPGQWATAQVRLNAPKPEAGVEVARTFTIVAAGGGRIAEASGSLVQASSARQSIRPIARVLVTLAGVMCMIIGAFGPWAGFSSLSGTEWTYLAYAEAINVSVEPLNADAQRFVPNILISAGIVAILFGALAAFGLTGRKGRLTRVCAILCALFVTVFLVGLWIGAGSGTPGLGAIVVYVGCVLAFIGGLVTDR